VRERDSRKNQLINLIEFVFERSISFHVQIGSIGSCEAQFESWSAVNEATLTI